MTEDRIPVPGAGARFVGQRVLRREDPRFLTGRGAYVDDVYLPGTLHAAFVRSDVARGAILSVDTKAAAAMPGVAAVFVASELNHLVREWWVDLEGPKVGSARPFRVLAEGDVRYVGELIAMVVADSRYEAEDAVEAVDVEIDPLPAVIRIERALDVTAPRVHPGSGSNITGILPESDTSELDGTVHSAPRVMTETFRQHRYACVPMETHLRYVVSEDCGVMINPNVVEGQIAGGVVQGIGGVLYEHIKYDDDGNPLATTFMDYLIPTAAEVPVIEYGHIETPAPTNAGGYKGMGEGGAIASPPAVMNAIADALAPLGAKVRDQPLGPAEIMALIAGHS